MLARGIHAKLPDFAGRNTLRASYTCCSFDNLWNVDTLLHRHRKKHQPVEKIPVHLSPSQQLPLKFTERQVPASSPGKRGKEKQAHRSIGRDEQRHAARKEATIGRELKGSATKYKDLTLTSQWRRQHAGSTANGILAWPGVELSSHTSFHINSTDLTSCRRSVVTYTFRALLNNEERQSSNSNKFRAAQLQKY